MSDIKPLYELLQLEIGKKQIDRTVVPLVVQNNLNPSFSIRPYQQAAFQLFINYWEEDFEKKPRQNHQLLFHMATGSGKTLMMAGLMLYLYEQGYRNFLFFVNSTNIINKTRDNFLNNRSSKYLFADHITLGDKRIDIREVSNFQGVNPNDINIVFSTIQGLHGSLNFPRENSLTYDDFEDEKIVLLSDEAHHINAETKKGDTPTSDELFETITWEGTVERIFKAHEHNILLEFTATVDFSDENLASKYMPKLIFDYPLKEFRKDGYSKEVKVLQADKTPFERAIQAVLLSQYRRKLFERYKKHIKPVLLFKSKTIKDSHAFQEVFQHGIQSLEVSTLEHIRFSNTEPILTKMFSYFDANNITMENLIIELKEDFSEDKLISVNSKEESEAKQLAVNSLEDTNNEYRAVFAVDKLNEGWDVLNLFDIVRLYDTRDSKGNKIGKTTMSEAQLIGRGARYCPFQILKDDLIDSRKYDEDLENELRICEELYYHSAHNPKYIQELNIALQELGIKAKDTRERKIHIKESFKDTLLYKSGHIFLNRQERYDRSDIDGLYATLIHQRHQVVLRTGYTKSSTVFEAQTADKGSTNRIAKDFTLLSFGLPIIRKATQRLDFYRFANLKHYLPNLHSMDEFISSEKYLGKIQLEVLGLKEQVDNLSPEEMLDAAIQVLESIAAVIASDKIEFKGTKTFEPFMFKEKFTDKTLNFAIDDGGDQEFGRSMNNPIETAYHLDLSQRDWFVFNDCFGTSEEKLLIQYIDKRHDELKRQYSDVYLIRNERHFKLYNFDDGRPLEPDFILYLIGKEEVDTMHYQVFIEPKGSHLLRADAWKENFLVSLKDNFKIESLFSNRKYAVWGLPFYNHDSRMPEFTEGFDKLIK
ncbi:MAG: DEAD/DEAH box helicase family protein [Gallionella sp.]